MLKNQFQEKKSFGMNLVEMWYFQFVLVFKEHRHLVIDKEIKNHVNAWGNHYKQSNRMKMVSKTIFIKPQHHKNTQFRDQKNQLKRLEWHDKCTFCNAMIIEM